MAAAAGADGGGGGGADAQDFAKVTLLGNPSVGKTCLMKKFVYSKWDPSYRVTLGADFGTKEVTLPSGKAVTAQVWDTAGQERFYSLGSSFYRNSDACMLVYDVQDPETLSNLSRWKQTFLSKTSGERGQDVIFVLLGNKSDLAPEDQAVRKEDGDAWCRENGCIAHFRVSAKTGDNVDQAFAKALDEVVSASRGPAVSGGDIPDKVVLDDAEPEPEKGGCAC